MRISDFMPSVQTVMAAPSPYSQRTCRCPASYRWVRRSFAKVEYRKAKKAMRAQRRPL